MLSSGTGLGSTRRRQGDLEGGAQVVDNRDGGGTTKFGITKRNNPDVDVANLTLAQASSIAKDRYWQPAYDDAHPASQPSPFDGGASTLHRSRGRLPPSTATIPWVP
ncbi:MAG: glycosyl hydrolase 108 family protein [Burkholderiales bacterium]